MGLKERIIHTTVSNLMTALSAGAGMFVMLKAMPWLIDSGLLHVTVVMK
jgi:hypothetical protein